MTQLPSPFAIRGPIGRHLDAVLTYWQELRRGAAEAPFADDVSLPRLKELCGKVFLLDAFAMPERFRFSVIEAGLKKADQERMLGRFIDEVDTRS